MKYIWLHIISIFLAVGLSYLISHKDMSLGGVESLPAEVTVQTSDEKSFPDLKNTKEDLQKIKPMEATQYESYPSSQSLTTFDWLGEYKVLTEVSSLFIHNERYGMPQCDNSVRGLLWFSPGKEDFPDQLLICMRNSDKITDWEILK